MHAMHPKTDRVTMEEYKLMRLENPWLSHTAGEPVHALDEPHVEAYNEILAGKPDLQLSMRSVDRPVPYLGNPDAPVLWLLANPGLSETDIYFADFHSQAGHASRTHEDKTLYPLLKCVKEDPARQWLESRLKEPIQELGRECVADNLFLVEYHPYHSVSYSQLPVTLPTQHYTFGLVRRAIQRKALIILSRPELAWQVAVPELRDADVARLSSSRSAHLSRKNLGPDNFDRIITLMRRNK